MVTGLDLFATHFAEYSDQYVLIGGSAAALLMQSLGAEFRATKDLDIVLLVESLHAEFANAFWDFIRKGGYQYQQKSSGKRIVYRFQKPSTEGYPFMLELFSRTHDLVHIPETSTLTPIPMPEEASSLSAILMHPAYYNFVKQHRLFIQQLPLIDAAALIALKAIAYADLTQRKRNGETIDSRDIRKHKNDIYRLYPILNLSQGCPVETSIHLDLQNAFQTLAQDPVDLKSLGLAEFSPAEILQNLSIYYSTPS